jgi:pyruvate/2-oxoglutarate/acetoin dehydrogenase E1 component
MSAYFDELCKAMDMLAEQPNVLFMGQAVACPGTGMSRTFKNVPKESLLELPVFEDTQMGMATGYALAGGLPVCVYPRMNFLLLAINQLVLHLDKLPRYSRGGYKPKVIIRTAIGAEYPLYPGVQHIGNYCEPLYLMLSSVVVVELRSAERIMDRYREAVSNPGSTILVERAGMY